METILSICLGLGLAAACGFRVFVPLLVVSAAAVSGHLTLASSFQWIGTWPALVAFSVATLLEVVGYYVPWVDNFLDSVATPAAVVAGTVISAAVFTNMSPFLQWTLAIVAGGTAAGVVQAGTVVTRAASTATTGGLGNPLVATGEWVLSLITSLLSAFLPLIAAFLMVLVFGFIGLRYWKRHKAGQTTEVELAKSGAGTA